MASQIILKVPPGVSEQGKKKAREAAILALWEAAELSTGEAADEMDMTYHDFLDLLAARGIPAESGPLNVKAIEEARQKLAGERG